MVNHEFDVPSSRVLALVEESNCSSYDCEFVALAHYLSTQLLTQDKKLLMEFPSTAISVADFLSQQS